MSSDDVLGWLVLPDAIPSGVPAPSVPPPPPHPTLPRTTPSPLPPLTPVDDFWPAAWLVDPDNLPSPEPMEPWVPPYCAMTGRRGHCFEDPTCECNGDGEHMPFYDSERGSETGDEEEEHESDGMDVVVWREDEFMYGEEADYDGILDTERDDEEGDIDDGNDGDDDDEILASSKTRCGGEKTA